MDKSSPSHTSITASDSVILETYQQVLDNTHDAIHICQDHKPVFINKSFTKLTGYDRETLLGLQLSEILDKESIEDPQVEKLFQSYNPDEYLSFDAFLITKDNERRLCRFDVRSISWHNKVARMVIIHDLTEQREHENLQKALFEITEAASFSPQIDILYEKVHKIISRLVQAENFVIALYNAERYEVTFPYFVDVNLASDNRVYKKQQAGNGIIEYLLRRGKATQITRRGLERLVHQKRLDYKEDFFHQWIGVPLFTQDNMVIGALATYTYDDTVSFNDKDLEILSFLSTQLAMAIEKKRAEDEIHESEEKYRLLVENIYDAIMVVQNDRFVFFNNVVCDLLGYTRMELAVNAFQNILGEDANEFYSSLQDQQGDFDKKSEKELTFIKKDSSKIFVETNSNVIQYRGHNALFIIFRDITERRRFLKMIEAERNLLRTLIDSIPDLIYMKNLDGAYILANSAYAIFCGYENAEQLIQADKIGHLESESARFHSQKDLEFLKGPKKSATFEEERMDAEGKSRWFLSTSVPLLDSANEKIAMISISRDITIQKKNEQELKASYAKIQNVQQEMLELERHNTALAVAVAANHELNQPLTVVSGYLQMLEATLGEENLTDEQKEYFRIMQDGFRRIQQILQKYREAHTVYIEKYLDMPMAVFDSKKE
jgi:PAS domain S-box-containing protein